jgi:hypothetical protein
MPADQHEREPGASPDAPSLDGVLLQEARDREFAQWLADLPAGVELMTALENLDLDTLSAFQRVEVVVAAGRLAARAHAMKARAAAAVDRHPDMRPPPARFRPGIGLRSAHLTAATLSFRMQTTSYEAELLVREGQAYAGVLADTGAALADGRICPGRSRAIVRGLGEEPVEVAVAAQAEVLPRAPGRTVRQVQQDVEAAVQRVDPEHAVDRHREARRGRAVSRPTVLQHGMAGSWVVLPAAEAVLVDAALDGAARAARAAGDGRNLDQLRADTLCDRVLGRAPGSPADAVPSRRDGPFELLHEAAHPDGGGGAGDGAADADVGPAADAADSVAPGVPVPAPGPQSPRTRVLVTMPLSTLIGLDDLPAALEGYGPIDAVQARALALGGVWQRILTDEVSGTVLDVGRTTYRPPTALAEHVRYRDKYCTAPGCPVPAARTDLDHSVEYDPPPPGAPPRPLGTTSADNLGPGCRHHHRLKTSGAFGVRQRTAGEFDWRTPSGHVFRVRPGTDEPTVHLTGPEIPDEPPPF